MYCPIRFQSNGTVLTEALAPLGEKSPHAVGGGGTTMNGGREEMLKVYRLMQRHAVRFFHYLWVT